MQQWSGHLKYKTQTLWPGSVNTHTHKPTHYLCIYRMGMSQTDSKYLSCVWHVARSKDSSAPTPNKDMDLCVVVMSCPPGVRARKMSVFLCLVFRKAFQRTKSCEMFVWCFCAVLWSRNKLWKMSTSYLMLHQFS